MSEELPRHKDAAVSLPHRRRPRYPGRNPRRFEEKYKERDPALHAETIAKVLASGKTPAGTHRPIMVAEILQVLAPGPGENGADCTLGHGGHAEVLLQRIQPAGRLFGLDVDPIELPKTESRLRSMGFGPETFTVHRSNFAGLLKIVHEADLPGLDFVLADLGVSSMQIDDPTRGFSVKFDGPLDMRMNPTRGFSASALLQRISTAALIDLLKENADEPHAQRLAPALAEKYFSTTHELAGAVRRTLSHAAAPERELSLRRVFQALRIAVNDEFSALETFLRFLPDCLNPGGRIALLTFHSGEDRRVKKAFQLGKQVGLYSRIQDDVLRPTAEERRANPRSSSAKLRWAVRAGLELEKTSGQNSFHRSAPY